MTPSPIRQVRQEQLRQHRRETLLYLIVPLLVSVLIVLLGIVVVLLLQRQLQVSLLADWILTVFVFCPSLICSTVICVLLMAGIFMMGRASKAAARPLEKLNTLTETVAERTTKAAESVNATTVKAASRFAFLDSLLNVFELPDAKKDTKEKSNDSNLTTQ